MMINPVLFSYVHICCVENNPEKKTLTIRVKSGDRKQQKIVYLNVLYSQLDRQSEGKILAVAEELTTDHLRSPKHHIATYQFLTDCKLQNLDPVQEMILKGYHLFTHYIGKDQESIVIAKNLMICE